MAMALTMGAGSRGKESQVRRVTSRAQFSQTHRLPRVASCAGRVKQETNRLMTKIEKLSTAIDWNAETADAKHNANTDAINGVEKKLDTKLKGMESQLQGIQQMLDRLCPTGGTGGVTTSTQ